MALNFIRYSFNEEELKDLKEAFTLLDTSGKGEIRPGAIIKEVEESQLNAKTPAVYAALADMPPDEPIKFEQFAEYCLVRLEEQHVIQALFEVLDHDKSVKRWLVIQ